MRSYVALLCLVFFPSTSSAQAVWRLDRSPSIEVGRAPIELHRVAGATFLQSGELAIADAGNNRIVIVSPQGRLVRALGRAGAGPGEFRGLSRLSVVGDTIIGYDALQNRTSAFRLDGTHLQTRPMASLDERPVFFRDALSAREYVGVIPVRSTAQTSGLRRDSIAIVLADTAARTLGTREWQYTYTVTQGMGSTTYGTPFLGQTHVEAVGDFIAIAPRGTATVEILDVAGGSSRRVNLPIRRRPLDRTVVTAYRDSLLASGATGASAERIRLVFGNRFPLPPGSPAPAVERMTVVGSNLWLKEAAAGDGPSSTWFVVDPAAARVIARVELPRAWAPLGGDARRVIVLVRDDSGVEGVRVYPIVNAPRS
jgi:hypothetical protein